MKYILKSRSRADKLTSHKSSVCTIRLIFSATFGLECACSYSVGLLHCLIPASVCQNLNPNLNNLQKRVMSVPPS